MALTVAASRAQPAKFEFTSVKVHPMAPGTYMIKNYTHGPRFIIPTSNKFSDTAYIQNLVMEAYGINEYQIMYLPGWTLPSGGIVYDIEGQAAAEGVPTPGQLQEMLQSLLADRFHLKAHWETKPKFSVNALAVDKNGPKFRPFHNDDGKATKPGPAGGPPFAGTTIFALARFLSQNLDFPVVDRTGLPDVLYDFNIDKLVDFHEEDREQAADPASAQDYLRTSVQRQLGLRLESRKESMQILAIDHIDEPSRD
jgi:uncharacterized protein (TIGR03435 family)